jgi:hypothetical protein
MKPTLLLSTLVIGLISVTPSSAQSVIGASRREASTPGRLPALASSEFCFGHALRRPESRISRCPSVAPAALIAPVPSEGPRNINHLISTATGLGFR